MCWKSWLYSSDHLNTLSCFSYHHIFLRDVILSFLDVLQAVLPGKKIYIMGSLSVEKKNQVQVFHFLDQNPPRTIKKRMTMSWKDSFAKSDYVLNRFIYMPSRYRFIRRAWMLILFIQSYRFEYYTFLLLTHSLFLSVFVMQVGRKEEDPEKILVIR